MAEMSDGLTELEDSNITVKAEARELLGPAVADAIMALDPPPQVVTAPMVETLRDRVSDAEGATTGDTQDTDTTDTTDTDTTDTEADTAGTDTSTMGDGTHPDRPDYHVEIAKQFEGNMDDKGVDQFVTYYNDRFARMRDLLKGRRQLDSPVSINRIDEGMAGDQVTLIAMVSELRRASSGRMIMGLEDDTGTIRALSPDEDSGDWLVEDEVIGLTGTLNDDGDFIFVDEIIRPDIPLSRSTRETDEEVHAAFISDIHYGSIDTDEQRLENLLEWLHAGEDIAGKISYLFINGDVVEGIGVYPGQDEELEREDIYDQYELFIDFVERVPDDIAVIVTPGNHDGVRLAEPQPMLPEEFCGQLHGMDNVYMVSNPATVHIHGQDTSPIRVLMYHGYSFDQHVDKIPDLREKGYEEPTHAMVDYLRRRHLAPRYGSNRLSPEDQDHMVIEEVPDIFVMGHTHAFDIRNYKSVNLISSGTMQSQTEFQKRMGHMPDPGLVAVVDLQSRDVNVKEVNPDA